MNCFVDEADFADPLFMFSIILPLLTEKGVKLFAASSAGAGGGMSALIEARYANGERLLNSVVLGEPCDACKLTDKPYECTHNLYDIADWKDPQRLQRVTEIYKACGRENELKAEMFSITGGTGNTVFKESLFRPLFTSGPDIAAASRDLIDVVYIGVDPAYGGSCEFAITAVGLSSMSKYKYQVIAMCREKLLNRDMQIVKDMIFKVIRAIAVNRRCAHAPLVIAIEACSGDAMYIAPLFVEAATKMGMSHCIMSEIGGNKQQGVPKDDKITLGLIATTCTLLSANAVCIAEDCAAVSSDFARPPMSMANQKSELASQFLRFRADPKTGKISGKQGAGQNDDLIITFMMCLYWSVKFCESERPDYDAFKRLKPVTFHTGTAENVAFKLVY